MRRFSIVIFVLIGAALMIFLLLNPLSIPFLPDFFGGERGDGAKVVAETTAGEEILYQCPMHSEVIEKEPGQCPICGMKLMPMKEQATNVAAQGTGDRKILYWYAPMDPTYISEEPGLSPMGMKLVPKYADERSGPGTEIRIDPGQIQNMGVVSERVQRTDLGRVIRTVGILDFDVDNVYWINLKFSGWIEKVYVNYVGQDIRKGQSLFEIYSPELVTTQEEFLRALEYRDSLAGSRRPETLKQAEDLLASARRRLSYWDISTQQVAEIEKSRDVQRTLQVSSPVDGVVVQVMDQALEGMFVTRGMNLYKLADLSSIWVHADVYESDLSGLREDQAADVELSYFPGETFRGKVLYLYPELNEKTRTVKVCVEIPNSNRRLRPGMYANVRIKGETLSDVVAVPDSAILRSGERNVVFLDLGEGRYGPQEVELGVRGEDNLVEILEGLQGGERVVVQAQFMLDSESRVQEAIRKMRSRKQEQVEVQGEEELPLPEVSGQVH
jgi:Cu(I)/Ag(I) efflux system membrane fusion protein/cobalt-zinc-cadmium efflux system membrane fusion protein